MNIDQQAKEHIRDVVDAEITWIRMTQPSNVTAVKALERIKERLQLPR